MSFDESAKRRLRVLARVLRDSHIDAERTASHDLESALRIVAKLEAFRDKAVEHWDWGKLAWTEICDDPEIK